MKSDGSVNMFLKALGGWRIKMGATEKPVYPPRWLLSNYEEASIEFAERNFEGIAKAFRDLILLEQRNLKELGL